MSSIPMPEGISREEARFEAIMDILSEFEIDPEEAEAAADRLCDFMRRAEQDLKADLMSAQKDLEDAASLKLG